MLCLNVLCLQFEHLTMSSQAFTENRCGNVCTHGERFFPCSFDLRNNCPLVKTIERHFYFGTEYKKNELVGHPPNYVLQKSIFTKIDSFKACVMF